jgi:Ras-related protein Rab-5C
LRFAEGYYKQRGRSATVGAFFLTKRLTVNSITCKMLLWDTAGQEQFQKLAVTYYKNAAAAILCYDVSNPRSLLNLRQRLEELKENITVGRIVVAIAACKCDLEPVPGLQDEARKLAKSVDALYVETSAKDDVGVTKLFSQTAERVLQWQKEAEQGYAPPLSVTLGGTSTRSLPSGSHFTRTNTSGATPAAGLATPPPQKGAEVDCSKKEDQDNSTANDSDDTVADAVDDKSKTPEAICAGGLLDCGNEDTESCVIL